jgi:hypothetical protein
MRITHAPSPPATHNIYLNDVVLLINGYSMNIVFKENGFVSRVPGPYARRIRHLRLNQGMGIDEFVSPSHLDLTIPTG